MVPTIILTEVRESNQPWFALITKNNPPNPSAMVVKYVNYVFVIDPTAMSRGSLWIRSFERFYSQDSNASNEGFFTTLGQISVAPGTARYFKVARDKIIYPGELATLLARFPIEDASYFAKGAMNRTHDQIFGTNQQITAREQKLLRELSAPQRAKSNRKRRLENKIRY